MNHLRTPRTLRFERLEARSLMAGNVIAVVDSNGLLTITGDSADNRLSIYHLASSGSADPWPGARYQIGEFPPGDPRTTINGQDSIIVEGVKAGIAINLGRGNDGVTVSRPEATGKIAAVPGYLSVNLGTGIDRAFLYIENHRHVRVRLGGDSDSVAISGRVNEMSILTDPEAPTSTNPAGDDTLRLFKFSARGAVNVDSGDGDDSIRGYWRTTTSAATVNFVSGAGDDSVEVGILQEQTALAASLRIETGSGIDDVSIVNLISTADITVNTGTDNDDVALDRMTTDSLLVWLAEQNDELFINRYVVSAHTRLGGGSGGDVLTQIQDGGNDLGELEIVGFEVIV